MSATWLGEHPDTRAAVVTLAEGWFQQQQLPANGVLSNEVRSMRCSNKCYEGPSLCTVGCADCTNAALLPGHMA